MILLESRRQGIWGEFHTKHVLGTDVSAIRQRGGGCHAAAAVGCSLAARALQAKRRTWIRRSR